MATRSFDREYVLKATEENIKLFESLNELEQEDYSVSVVDVEHDNLGEILRVVVPKRDE